MKSLACLILCFATLTTAGSAQASGPVPGKVTLLYFWAAWCGPCRQLSPALQQLADSDHDIALRKVNADEETAALEEHKVTALPVVKVYNQSGSLVGTVVGADMTKVKSYVAQAKGG